MNYNCFVFLETEPRAGCRLSKHVTSELPPPPRLSKLITSEIPESQALLRGDGLRTQVFSLLNEGAVMEGHGKR